jgi:hypothetical protein
LRTGRPAFVLSVGAADEQAYHLLPHDNVVVWVNCTPFRKDQTPTITSGFGISRLCATVFARWLFSLYQQPYFWMVDDNVAFVTGLPDNLQDLEQPAINVNVPFLGFAPDNDRKLREPEDPNNKDNLLKILRPKTTRSVFLRDNWGQIGLGGQPRWQDPTAENISKAFKQPTEQKNTQPQMAVLWNVNTLAGDYSTPFNPSLSPAKRT